MKIEVWSDYVCPFCYIGKRLLEQALEETKIDAEVVFKSYELDPVSESDPNMSIHQELAEKYQMTVEQAKANTQQLVERAKSVGLDYNFDNQKKTNTFDVHRLAKFAETKGKADAFTERALGAHFVESKFLGEQDTLIQLATEVGLEEAEVKAVLASDQFTKEVRQDEQEAREIGVRGVPFFVINRKYAISGAQPLEVFVNTLKKINEEA